MGKSYALTKKEILRIPEYLHSIFMEYKLSDSKLILYYWFIQLFEFVAILSVNTYKKPGAKKVLASFSTVERYITRQSGFMRGQSTSLINFMSLFSRLRNLLTHDINKFPVFSNEVTNLLKKSNFRDFDNLFTIIKVYDPEVSGIDLSELERDIKYLYNSFNKSESSSQQSAATSTLDAIADISKKYGF